MCPIVTERTTVTVDPRPAFRRKMFGADIETLNQLQGMSPWGWFSVSEGLGHPFLFAILAALLVCVSGYGYGDIPYGDVPGPEEQTPESDPEEIEHRLQEALESLEITNEAYRVASKRFEELFRGIPIAAFTVDSEGLVFEWNAACEELTGVQSFITFTQDIRDVLHGEGVNEGVDRILGEVFDGSPFNNIPMTLHLDDGTERDVLLSAFPLRSADGKITGAVGAMADVTVEQRSKVVKQQQHDSLRTMIDRLPVGAVFVEDGKVWINRRGHEMIGAERDSVATFDAWLERVAGSDYATAQELLKSIRKSRYSVRPTVPFRQGKGGARYFHLSGFALETGEAWLFYDVTEQYLSQGKFRVLFDQAVDGFLLMNDRGTDLEINGAALRHLSLSEESRPRRSTDLLQSLDEESRTALGKFFRKARRKDSLREEVEICNLEGERRILECCSTRAEILGEQMVFIQLVEETQRISAERDILRMRADLLDAQELAGVGSFEGNVHTGEFTWSPQLKRLYGYSATSEIQTTATFRAIFNHFHVEDRKRFAEAFLGVVRDGVPRTLEGRVIAADGTEKYVRASARRLMVDGRIIGTVQDLTEIHRQHEEIVQSEALMRAIVNSMQAGLTLLSPEAEIVFYNDAALRMIGIEKLPSGDYKSPGVVEVVNSLNEPIDHSERPGIRALDQGYVSENVELGYVMRDGTTRWLNVNAAPVVSPEDNTVLGAVSTFVDVSEQREQKRLLEEQVSVANRLASMLEKKNKQLSRANQRLHQMATTDGLTGLTNHRAFQEFLEKYYHQAVRTGAPLSVMLIDVDHFKAFNDTFGHQEGDYVLRQLGRIFQRAARKGDIVARYGGEEFCIILVNADPKASQQVAERLREKVASTSWRLRKVTVSIGLSTLEPSMAKAAVQTEKLEKK